MTSFYQEINIYRFYRIFNLLSYLTYFVIILCFSDFVAKEKTTNQATKTRNH